jgi:hypothetical protein
MVMCTCTTSPADSQCLDVDSVPCPGLTQECSAEPTEHGQLHRRSSSSFPSFGTFPLVTTPSSKPELVQAVFDAILINNVESWHGRGLDFTTYMHKKDIEQQFIEKTFTSS